MADIRQELETRLDAVEQEKKVIEERISELVEMSKALQIIMIEEKKRFGKLPNFISKPNTNSDSLKEINTVMSEKEMLILESLSDAPSTLREIVELAESSSVDFEGKLPGRVLNQVLMALKRDGYTSMPDRSKWSLTPKGMEARSRMLAKRTTPNLIKSDPAERVEA